MNRKIFFLILIVGFIVLLAGCAPAPATPTIPTTPTTYTIKVISQCPACWGNVWVDGVASGAYLITNGAVNISGVRAGAAIQLVDEFGNGSHTEFFNPPNTTIVFNYWW